VALEFTFETCLRLYTKILGVSFNYEQKTKVPGVKAKFNVDYCNQLNRVESSCIRLLTPPQPPPLPHCRPGPVHYAPSCSPRPLFTTSFFTTSTVHTVPCSPRPSCRKIFFTFHPFSSHSTHSHN
jgi:hypothetical protein